MRFLLLLFALLSLAPLFAQTPASDLQPPAREIGLRLFSLEDFSLVYKKERRPQRYWRLNLAFGQLQLDPGTNIRANVQFGAGFGWERRRPIDDRLYFLTGPQLGLSVNLNAGEGVNTVAGLLPSVQYLLGLQYDLNDHFYINLELLPTLSASFLLRNGPSNPNFSLGFNTRSVGVTVAHRF